jgi:hypothetical protein
LYTIGFYVPGFSALTVGWIVSFSIMIVLGSWLAVRMIGREINRWGQFLITFLVTTVVVFIASYAIEGGHVPLGATLLASLVIAVLTMLVADKPVSKLKSQF